VQPVPAAAIPRERLAWAAGAERRYAAGIWIQRMSHEDIVDQGLPADLDWSPNHQVDSLNRVCKYVLAHCDNMIGWYRREKRAKSRWGKLLRFLAILLSGAAGLMPILSELVVKQISEFAPHLFAPGPLPTISASWSTVALALAALMIAMDRFFGISSGWIRYEQALQRLSQRRTSFEFSWQELLLAREQNLTVIDIQMAVSLCRDVLQDVNRIVAEETNQWAGEFNRRLSDFDSTLPLTELKS
jgi:hypothetical protein